MLPLLILSQGQAAAERLVCVQTCDQYTSVKDVKAHLVTLESVEEAQILLVHAGRPLSDTAIPMLDLENFNRAGEIMLDLQVKI